MILLIGVPVVPQLENEPAGSSNRGAKVARFYFKNIDLVVVVVYLLPSNEEESNKAIDEITNIYNKKNEQTSDIEWRRYINGWKKTTLWTLIDFCTQQQKRSHGSDHKAVSLILWLESQIFSTTRATEKNRRHYRTIYMYDNATVEEWKMYRSILNKKLNDGKEIFEKLECAENESSEKGSRNVQLIDQAWSIIKSSILEAANKSIPKKKEPNSSMEDWYEDMKGWWKIINKKRMDEIAAHKKKEIEECIECQCKIIEKEQGRMLN
ncbi:10047_t:CDS:2, partial [Gigaspora margarita]